MGRVHRLPWRLLAGMALTLAGLALGWLWFRDSSFAAVERVAVTGSGSSERAQVRAALETAAVGMSTLRVDDDALREAVEPFDSVAGLRVRGDFPHDLRVEVLEHEPVAELETGGSSVLVTGGGLLLDAVRASDLPAVTSRRAVAGGRVQDPRALAALSVAAAAPLELRTRSVRLRYERAGLTVDLRDGPDLIFGTAADAAVKWRAAARVLREESAAGATYLDVRVPKLVAAGGVGPVEPTPTPAPPTPQSGPSTIG